MFDKINALYRALHREEAVWTIKAGGGGVFIAAEACSQKKYDSLEKAIMGTEESLLREAANSEALNKAESKLQSAEEAVKRLREDVETLKAARDEWAEKEHRARLVMF